MESIVVLGNEFNNLDATIATVLRGGREGSHLPAAIVNATLGDTAQSYSGTRSASTLSD